LFLNKGIRMYMDCFEMMLLENSDDTIGLV